MLFYTECFDTSDAGEWWENKLRRVISGRECAQEWCEGEWFDCRIPHQFPVVFIGSTEELARLVHRDLPKMDEVARQYWLSVL